MSIQYKVYLTPRSSETVYGTEIEITDYVLDTGLSMIRRGIDSTDYDMGAFFYDDLQLKCYNRDGYFNDEQDIRSIFTFSRDKTKIRVVYTDPNADTIVFRGLLNEEATRLDASRDEIVFRCLSRDSVIRTSRVSGGTITDGVTVKTALIAILNKPEITSVLNFSEANINPANNITIDNGAKLEEKSAREALNQLLVVSNSVLIIDASDNIIVQSRVHNDIDILYLYGPFDLKRRQNIIDIKNYNNGKQRLFTAFKINDTEELNTGYQQAFGYKQKKITAEFITALATEITIAQALVDEFKVPKVELEVIVQTSVARNVKVLDPVSINHPLRIDPVAGKFFPIVGQAKIGDSMTPLPYKFGSVSIPEQMGFKVIEIKEDPRSFQTTLKLRQIGTDTGDGFFTADTCARIGLATIGVGTVCGTGDIADGYNPSVVGAAVVGYTEVA